ncbi:SDR family NAD(P)-dependent oxidoreductase [Sphingobacterium oryzagri]|uniref:SDR family NAD(P)-dependent oxidoreductase n=1 Tax=Sphingobacterium oryzagri TaxID=3025669 RepID=A0ABY7WCX0_9SPHI|nr:SDR family NAD(P)-dependent oxidoreductase [Sphingobacterium sp. KACC 22765]WDF67507.1 SDR family NAD(P)-dependent oxidoreductase [Sphingobacterium sp. KACC 22765]
MKKQRTWFITGASKGFGLALTKLALSQGDNVISTSRNGDALRAAVGEHGANFLPLQVDITADSAVKQAIDHAIQHFGQIDVVVNNAGYSLVGSVEEMDDAAFRETMDVNLFATVHVIRHIMPHFRAQQTGHIINIASIAGYYGIPCAASYNAAKFAVVGLSEGLAKEVEPLGIHVTVIAPGEFRTNFMDKGSIKYVENRIPIYGIDEAEESWTASSGQQLGDPEKLVKIITEIVAMEKPPKRLLLGPDAYAMYTEQKATETEEIEQWKSTTLSTNFD